MIFHSVWSHNDFLRRTKFTRSTIFNIVTYVPAINTRMNTVSTNEFFNERLSLLSDDGISCVCVCSFSTRFMFTWGHTKKREDIKNKYLKNTYLKNTYLKKIIICCNIYNVDNIRSCLLFSRKNETRNNFFTHLFFSFAPSKKKYVPPTNKHTVFFQTTHVIYNINKQNVTIRTEGNTKKKKNDNRINDS